MAKEKKEINLRELSEHELTAKLTESKEKLFHLKFGHKTTPLKNPLEIRALRRQIARILTLTNPANQKAQAIKEVNKK